MYLFFNFNRNENTLEIKFCEICDSILLFYFRHLSFKINWVKGWNSITWSRVFCSFCEFYYHNNKKKIYSHIQRVTSLGLMLTQLWYHLKINLIWKSVKCLEDNKLLGDLNYLKLEILDLQQSFFLELRNRCFKILKFFNFHCLFHNENH